MKEKNKKEGIHDFFLQPSGIARTKLLTKWHPPYICVSNRSRVIQQKPSKLSLNTRFTVLSYECRKQPRKNSIAGTLIGSRFTLMWSVHMAALV